jgi:hypothetical protein
MPTIPRLPPQTQETERARAIRLAAQLTPIQRHVLALAGLPGWMRLAHPWYPPAGRLRAVARALSAPEYDLLAARHASASDTAVDLTHLGELVAGMWLLAALAGAIAPADVRAAPSPSAVPFRR